MASIEQVQDDIIENFSLFESDMESKLFYLMDLGKKLPEMQAEHKTDEFIVKGCQSKVWLYPVFNDGILGFEADSNTEVTKGLISLLVQVWNNRTPQEILASELYFIEKIGMGSMIGSQRSNGFASMIKQIRMFATAFQSQIKQ